MYFVYIIQSIKYPSKHYTGITSDFPKRLEEHNAGKSIHTNKFRPWKLQVVLEFADEKKAAAFERYLKSGSGRMLAIRHF